MSVTLVGRPEHVGHSVYLKIGNELYSSSSQAIKNQCFDAWNAWENKCFEPNKPHWPECRVEVDGKEIVYITINGEG